MSAVGTRHRSAAVVGTLAALTLVLQVAIVGDSGPARSAATPGWSAGPALPSTFNPRWDAAVAYYPPADQVVIFGGSPRIKGDVWRNDTWVLRNNTWSRVTAPAGLTPRGGAAMAYDPAIRKIVLFGGTGPAWPPLNDTWLWDGTSWQRGPAAPASLLGRVGAGMAYQSNIGKMVLFGGAGKLPFTDTWFFDDTAWKPGPPAPAGMPIRAFFGMTYDRVLKKTVVTGGDGGRGVWLFDGYSWKPGPSLPAAVGPRERVRMAYDPVQGGAVLFGGMGPGAAQSDMWVLRGGAWQQILKKTPTSPWPSARLDGALVWATGPSALFLVGGFSDVGFGDRGYVDTWWYRP